MKVKPWFRYTPPRSRDFRRAVTGVPNTSQLEREREIRSRILAASPTWADRERGRQLAKAKPGVPAALGCCPINGQLYQVYIVSRAMKVIKDCPKAWMVTIYDQDTAISTHELKTFNWKRHHDRVRRRLQRALGKAFVAVGFGEIDWADDAKVFRPHHHVVMANTSANDIESLRRYYPTERSMKVQPLANPLRQIAYASKLVVYCRPLQQGSATRGRAQRLPTKQFRAHMAYLSEHEFTEFVFCMNCRLDGR
jgi:hypothetical protein